MFIKQRKMAEKAFFPHTQILVRKWILHSEYVENYKHIWNKFLSELNPLDPTTFGRRRGVWLIHLCSCMQGANRKSWCGCSQLAWVEKDSVCMWASSLGPETWKYEEYLLVYAPRETLIWLNEVPTLNPVFYWQNNHNQALKSFKNTYSTCNLFYLESDHGLCALIYTPRNPNVNNDRQEKQICYLMCSSPNLFTLC